MRVTRGEDGEALDMRFDFWHGPDDRWRIEHGGDVVYLSAPGSEPLLRIDDQMRRLGGDIRVVHLGSAFSPLDLLGPDSLLRRMSTGMRVSEAPHRIEIGGRTAWSTTLASRDDKPVGIAFDDATGIIVRVSGSDQMLLLEVTDVVEHTDIPADRFVWEGPVVEAPPRARDSRRSPSDPRTQHAQRVEILTAIVAALDQPHEVLRAIEASVGDDAAKNAITELLGVSEIGADAVVSMQLRRFTPDVSRKIRNELIEMHDNPPPSGD
jgi:hypothetical protein